jgi:hypothetical protein
MLKILITLAAYWWGQRLWLLERSNNVMQLEDVIDEAIAPKL